MDNKEIISDSSSPDTDRISDLPSNIIDCILDRTTLRDAVATSVLSKRWRHKWRTIPNLIFDEDFDLSIRPSREAEMMFLEYSCIISKILLLHLGPIHKFVLHIPKRFNKFYLDISSWMLFISQNEVKVLRIEARNDKIFKLPSYLFYCNKLQHLQLDVRKLRLHLPEDFGGFCNLLSLDLSGFLDGDEISKLISKCPLLERLSLWCLSCSQPFVVDASRVHFLHVYCSENTSFQLINAHSLTTISLRFRHPGTINFCVLFDIFCSVPNVKIVTLRTVRTITAMPQDAPTSFPTTLHNHTTLTLLDVAISSHQCIHSVLCILKSSPNLQTLNLRIQSSGTNEDEAAIHFLDIQTREPPTLNNLLTVKIQKLSGSKVELMFIKLILSCSPILEAMYLNGAIFYEAEFTFVTELLKCKRPSPQAQLIYSRHPVDRSIFNF